MLPVMGAVPDGAIVLFSGLGPVAAAQEQLSVGVGTLAGSTIMLLTVSWGMCTILGRVDVDKNDDGSARLNYRPRPRGSPKLTNGYGLFNTGTQADRGTMRSGALIMFVTALTYFLIQGPAFAMVGEAAPEEAAKQRGWAIAGFVLAILFFAGYSAFQVLAGEDDQQKKKDASIAKAAQRGGVSLEALLSDSAFRSGSSDVAAASAGLEATLSQGRGADDRDRKNLKTFIRALFHNVRSLVKDDDFVDAQEAEIMVASLLGPADRRDIDVPALMERYGMKDDSGAYVLHESGFETLFTDWFLEHARSKLAKRRSGCCVKPGDCGRLLCSVLSCGVVRSSAPSSASSHGQSSGAINGGSVGMGPRRKTGHFVADMKSRALLAEPGAMAAADHGGPEVTIDDEEEEEEEEEDEEDEGAGLTRGQIYLKALGLMVVGVVVVTVFSDPMVDVLTVLGKRIGVQPFYVSFIVTPIVSNASELISSLIFAMRRTKKTITLTYSQLMGAATMNNTFVLALFLGLCAFRGLAWTFSAEVMAIFAVQAIMAVVAVQDVQTTGLSIFVLALYPLSIFLVFALETYAGWQ